MPDRVDTYAGLAWMLDPFFFGSDQIGSRDVNGCNAGLDRYVESDRISYRIEDWIE